jgi:hypothetical protein
MDIFVNLINLLSDKINDMSDKNIINIVLSKLDFSPKYYKVIKNDKIKKKTMHHPHFAYLTS